ncbi:MAG: hypothetical protein J1F66_01835 [Clostridiales bacterium]|nr:hypothetical protein [Clostridiales bacterium]
MFYWILWLIIGIVFNIFFSFVAPCVFSKLMNAAQEGNRRAKLSYLTVFSAVVALDVSTLCWVIATYVTQSEAEFAYLNLQGAPILWSIYVAVGVAAVVFVVGVLILKFAPKRSDSRASSSDLRPKAKNMDWFFATQIALLVLAMAVAAVILTLIMDYILLKLASLFTVKRLLLAGVAAEIVAVAVICVVRRKSVWRRRRAILLATSATLFCLLIAGYVLLANCTADDIERVMIFAGSGVFVILPMASVTALMFSRGLRRTNNPILD